MFKQLFLVLATALPVIAWADAAADLNLSLDAIQTLQGRFDQILKDKEGEVLQKSSGQFTLKRPGYFYWESAAPYEQTVIGTPEKVWVYDPDLEQVTVRKNAQQQNSPAAIISGDLAKLKSTFAISVLSEKGKSIYTLLPVSDDDSYKKVTLEFSGKELSALNFWDKLDQSTNIHFSKTQLNQKVDENLFDFKVPAGADVILDE